MADSNAGSGRFEGEDGNMSKSDCDCVCDCGRHCGCVSDCGHGYGCTEVGSCNEVLETVHTSLTLLVDLYLHLRGGRRCSTRAIPMTDRSH